MRKMIDGTARDTNDMEAVAHRWNGYGGKDYYCENLYKADDGEYFVLRQFREYDLTDDAFDLEQCYGHSAEWLGDDGLAD